MGLRFVSLSAFSTSLFLHFVLGILCTFTPKPKAEYELSASKARYAKLRRFLPTRKFYFLRFAIIIHASHVFCVSFLFSLSDEKEKKQNSSNAKDLDLS